MDSHAQVKFGHLALAAVAILLSGCQDEGTTTTTTPPPHPTHTTTTATTESLGQSLADCKRVAQAFRNTCNHDAWSTPATSVAEMEYETFPCSQDESWERKVCVTCREDHGVTKIRVQTNSMPDHCIHQVGKLKPQNYDYEVEFNRLESKDDMINSFGTQRQVDMGVCTLKKHYDDALLFEEKGDDTLIWGTAINGVSFQFANQIHEDPVSPITVTNEQPLDLCLGHIQRDKVDGIYHYHHVSPCINPNFLEQKQVEVVNECVKTTGPGCCSENLTAWVFSGWESMDSGDTVDGRTIIGLSRDGHVLYGPYRQGERWGVEDVDTCNGAWDVDGDYFYVGTPWHPYLVGCEGPANSYSDSGVFPSCSTNGLDKYWDPPSSLLA